ncbi:hypothetical protein ACFX2G_033434 [Malus domestica]
MRFEESVERSDCVNLGKTNGDVGEYRGFNVVEGVDYESRNSSKGLGRLFHEECEQTGWSYNVGSLHKIGRSLRRKRPSIPGTSLTF